MDLQRVGHDWATNTHTHFLILKLSKQKQRDWKVYRRSIIHILPVIHICSFLCMSKTIPLIHPLLLFLSLETKCVQNAKISKLNETWFLPWGSSWCHRKIRTYTRSALGVLQMLREHGSKYRIKALRKLFQWWWHLSLTLKGRRFQDKRDNMKKMWLNDQVIEGIRRRWLWDYELNYSGKL